MGLFTSFIVRSLLQDKIRSAATIGGIALGIGVILAIRMANTSSVRGFEAALEYVAGRTSLEIVSPGGRLDETALKELHWLSEYGETSPVIETEAGARRPDGSVELLHVLGIDILRDRRFREYRLLEPRESLPERDSREFLQLLLDPRAVILTEKYARRSGIAIGDSVALVAGDRVIPFRVAGLLADQGPARAFDGNFVLMDIAAAQWALGSLGLLTRIDLRLAAGSGIDEAERDIRARLPENLSVQRPARRGRQVEKMLEAFHFNLSALSYIALLVGLFLIYNTVAVSVIRRREEIGTLRALGASRRTVLFLFLGEACLLASVGTVAGLFLARYMAYGAVRLTSTTIHVLYRGIVSLPAPIGYHDVVLALGIGIPLSLLAAILPALEASGVSPLVAMRGVDRLESRIRPGRWSILAPAGLFLLGGWLATRETVNGLPVFGFLSALALVFGGAFLTPATLFLLARAARRPLRRLLKVEGLLAHSNLAGSIPSLSVSVAALALSLSMMTAIAVMVSSFRDTVIYWVGQTLQADLYISPSSRNGRTGDSGISPEVDRIVSSHPAVAAVDRFHQREVSFGDRTVLIGAGDFPVLLQHGRLLFKSPSDGRDALRRAIGADDVVVSESFAIRYRRRPGDTVLLPTQKGPAKFRIAAVYYDYSNDRGTLVMDGGTFEKHYGPFRPSGLTVYLRDGNDPDRVRSELVGALGKRFSLFVSTQATLRREILSIFDSTFAVTYALELIAVFVAILGVATTLFTLVLERRREFALLRLIGTDASQVRRMVMIEAVLIGTASQAIGLGVGLLLSFLLIFVINVQSFGWTIQFHLPVLFLTQMSILTLAATALAGLFPARKVCALNATGQMTTE